MQDRVMRAVDERNRSVGAWKTYLLDEDTQAWLTELRVIIDHAHGRLKVITEDDERRPLLGRLHNAERAADACRWLYDIAKMRRAEGIRHHAERALEAIARDPARAVELVAEYVTHHRGGTPLHEPIKPRTP